MKIKMLPSRPTIVKTAIHLIAVQAVIMLAAGHLYAQQVFKSVDKNGRVTYSEMPPLPGSGDKLTADSASSPSLPTANCGPCVNAKLMLSQRGVPFTERTVSSNEDIDAYKKLNSDNNFPLATIAAQQLKGYEETEWTKYLDAAGYPKSSALPRNFRNSEATSLTPKKVAEKEVAEKPAAKPVRPAAAAPQEPSNNPAGIRF
jgi:glutaredoxin